MRAVHCPISLSAHAKAEKVRFADDEVEILVIDLADALRRPSLRRLRREVFEDWPGYRGKKVDICGRVQAFLEVLRYTLEVGRCRVDEVNDWDVRYRVPLGIYVPTVNFVSSAGDLSTVYFTRQQNAGAGPTGVL